MRYMTAFIVTSTYDSGRTGSEIYKFVNEWMLLSGFASIDGNDLSLHLMVYIEILLDLSAVFALNTPNFRDARS